MVEPSCPSPEPPAKPSSGRTILIVLACVGAAFVVLVGVLGVAGLFGMRRFVREAKKAEGRNLVGMMARSMVRCVENEEGAPPPTPWELPPSSPPVPLTLAEVSGKKYLSSPADWASPAFACARFSVHEPQYFQYQWERVSPGLGFVRARADLDGDGRPDAAFEQEVRCDAHGECTIGLTVER